MVGQRLRRFTRYGPLRRRGHVIEGFPYMSRHVGSVGDLAFTLSPPPPPPLSLNGVACALLPPKLRRKDWTGNLNTQHVVTGSGDMKQ